MVKGRLPEAIMINLHLFCDSKLIDVKKLAAVICC
jgi:hypothetical protein